MKLLKKMFKAALLILLLAFAANRIYLELSVSMEEHEKERRELVVTTAQKWLGTQEGDERHREILSIYNTHTPLAKNYTVKASDDWCATFASAVAIACDLTKLIPTECGCERQIELWQNLGRWEENDNYYPLPGDYIYYSWDEPFSFGDNRGWADHVGIVVETNGQFIKVIEGNKDDCVTYRTVIQGDYRIRGYGLPDYRK